MMHTIQWAGPAGSDSPFMGVNGDRRETTVNARTSLRDALREPPDLTGTRAAHRSMWPEEPCP